MKHINAISSGATAKQDSFEEALFFQFFFTILSIMLTAAFGEK